MDPLEPAPSAPVDLRSGHPATELLLIRHGRAADPATPGEDPDLHEDGHRQAEALARRLAPEHKHIDAIYCSDMRRAAQTAQPLALAHGLPTAVRADLREVDLGDWEGGVFARVAAAGDPLYREFARVGRFELVPNAESDEHLRERVSAALSEITLAHPGETVAVVVHLGVINAVLAELVEGPRTITIMLEHTSVTVVRAFADGSRDLVVANDCHHLYDPVLGRPASVPT